MWAIMGTTHNTRSIITTYTERGIIRSNKTATLRIIIIIIPFNKANSRPIM